MMTTKAWLRALGPSAAGLALLATTPLHAEEQDEALASASTSDEWRPHADVEIDPLAYAFGGHSVHMGIGYGKLRVDLGAFALDNPGFLEPTNGLQTSTSGFGLKLQYFPFQEQKGAFIGVQSELVSTLIESERSNAAHRDRGLTAGLLVGWRFPIVAGLYVTPWVLLNYDIDAEDVELDGLRHEGSGLNPPVPLVHIGYSFL